VQIVFTTVGYIKLDHLSGKILKEFNIYLIFNDYN